MGVFNSDAAAALRHASIADGDIAAPRDSQDMEATVLEPEVMKFWQGVLAVGSEEGDIEE